MALRKNFLFLILLFFVVLPCYSQNHIDLDSIVVSARIGDLYIKRDYKLLKVITKEQIEAMPVSNIAQLLDMIGNIDIKYRGAGNVQADLSINGGGFNDVLLLINGIKYIDYQTGHFNFNLPISIDMIERIEVLLASDARRYGVNAFSGAINIITKKSSQNVLSTKLGIFQQSLKPIVGFDLVSIGNRGKTFSAIGVSAEQSEGYMENTDYSTFKFFFANVIERENYNLFIQGGFLLNKFGAFNFYTPKFPWQYEENNAQFVSAKVEVGDNWSFVFSWRRHQDKFELFREGNNWYQLEGEYYIRGNDTAIIAPGLYYERHNYHANNLFSFEANKVIDTKLGQINFCLVADYYFLHSTVMGDDLTNPIHIPFEEGKFFYKRAQRYNVNLSVNHIFKSNNFTISSGISQLYNSYFGIVYAGGIDMSYLFAPKMSFILGGNKSVRFPTFTEMYYTDAVHIANPYLKPQERWMFNTGFKFLDKNLISLASGFYAKNFRQIEWVMDENTGVYTSQNLTNFASYGVNLSLKYFFSDKFVFFDKFFVSYTYLNYRDFSYPLSKYSANLTHHKFSTLLETRIINSDDYKLLFVYNLIYKQRFVNVMTTDKKDLFLNNVSLKMDMHKLIISLNISNIFNVQWFDYYTPMPGRHFIFNIKFKF